MLKKERPTEESCAVHRRTSMYLHLCSHYYSCESVTIVTATRDAPLVGIANRSSAPNEIVSRRTPVRIRVATYSVHKCRGLDRRTSRAFHLSSQSQQDAQQFSEKWESRRNRGVVLLYLCSALGGCPGDSVSKCMKKSKLRNHLERSRLSVGSFSNLVDECRRSVA